MVKDSGLDEEFGKLLDDDELFAKNFLKIPTKPDAEGKSSLVPMVYTRVQSYLAKNLTLRNIIVKPRQITVSTGILARNFRFVLINELVRVLLIAHKDDSTKMLLDRVYGFYNNLPKQMKLPMDKESQKQMRFEGREGGMHIETAGARVSGRSETISRAHLSEFAHWDKDKTKELYAGISQAAAEGEITIESTPNGSSGDFYEMYQEAKRGESAFKPFFFPWWWDAEYKYERGHPLANPQDRGKLTYTKEEQLLCNKFRLSEEQIRWRRAKITVLKELFPQEYPENDIDCWLTAGLAVFNVLGVRRQQLQNLSQPILEEDFIKYFKMPVGGRKYIFGVDTGKGLEHGDFSVCTAIDDLHCEQQFVYRVRIGADLFAERVKYLAKKYNNANISVETTGGYGEVVLKVLEDYPYVWQDPSTLQRGWNTNVRTRPLMISNLDTYIRSGNIIIHDDTTIQEIRDFQDIGGKLDVPRGSHDDCLFALMLALVIQQYYPVAHTRGKVVRYH